MQAEIIAIGDELLIGQTVNTNAAWLGELLNQSGIRVHRSSVISDNREEILSSFDEALGRSDLVLVTGGLGPTRDDITKHTLCEYFSTRLVLDEPSLLRITEMFASRGMELIEVNRLQAMVPEACTVIPNSRGTANGMWFEKNGKILISMPGVPYEMHAMMQDSVMPAVLAHFERPAIVHRTILTAGVGESYLAETIREWEDSLSDEDIKLAYLPSPGLVKLRMSAYGSQDRQDTLQKIRRKENELLELIRDTVYGYDTDTLQGVTGKLIKEKGMSVATAESCTGGFLGHLITSVPGSSSYFKGGVIAYSYEAKEQQLGVPMEKLEKDGAVNEEVAILMARGVRERLGATFGISTTGVAGPDADPSGVPVGTVWLGIAGPHRSFAVMTKYGKSRERTIQVASQNALNLLRKEILGLNK